MNVEAASSKSLHLSRFCVLAVLICAVTLAGCSRKQDSTQPSTTSMPAPPEVNIAYGPVTGCPGPTQDGCGGSQTLDIFRATGTTPETKTEGKPRKVTLWVHGGGFVAADKAGSLSKYYKGLLDDGWDIVSINYRLTQNGKNVFPASVQDVKRAVRWVKANAASQGWDPDQVAAIGHSAGGNLVEMLATTVGDPVLEPTDLPPEMTKVDSSVTSVVSLAAVSDMRLFKQTGMFNKVVDEYLGCSTNCDALFDAASVQTHVTAEARPILAIHGAKDPYSSPENGKLVHAAYDAAGIGNRFKMIVVDDGPVDFQSHIPDMRRWIDDVKDWLDGHLR